MTKKIFLISITIFIKLHLIAQNDTVLKINHLNPKFYYKVGFERVFKNKCHSEVVDILDSFYTCNIDSNGWRITRIVKGRWTGTFIFQTEFDTNFSNCRYSKYNKWKKCKQTEIELENLFSLIENVNGLVIEYSEIENYSNSELDNCYYDVWVVSKNKSIKFIVISTGLLSSERFIYILGLINNNNVLNFYKIGVEKELWIP